MFFLWEPLSFFFFFLFFFLYSCWKWIGSRKKWKCPWGRHNFALFLNCEYLGKKSAVAALLFLSFLSLGKCLLVKPQATIYNTCVVSVESRCSAASIVFPVPRVPPWCARCFPHHLSHLGLFNVLCKWVYFPFKTILLVSPFGSATWTQPVMTIKGRRTSVPELNVKLFKGSVVRRRLLTLMHCMSIKHYGNGSGATWLV